MSDRIKAIRARDRKDIGYAQQIAALHELDECADACPQAYLDRHALLAEIDRLKVGLTEVSELADKRLEAAIAKGEILQTISDRLVAAQKEIDRLTLDYDILTEAHAKLVVASEKRKVALAEYQTPYHDDEADDDFYGMTATEYAGAWKRWRAELAEAQLEARCAHASLMDGSDYAAGRDDGKQAERQRCVEVVQAGLYYEPTQMPSEKQYNRALRWAIKAIQEK